MPSFYINFIGFCLFLLFVFWSLSTQGLRYSGDTCIRFAYYMYGSGIGQLKVYTRFRGEANPIFSESSNQGSLWFEAAIDINIVYADSVQ